MNDATTYLTEIYKKPRMNAKEDSKNQTECIEKKCPGDQHVLMAAAVTWAYQRGRRRISIKTIMTNDNGCCTKKGA